MRWLLVAGLAFGCRNSQPPPPPANATCANGYAEACLQDCDRGSDAACEKLEAIDLRRPGAAGHQECAVLVQRLCETGRHYFCPTFAFALANGDGVVADRTRALDLFQKTCEDDPKGCSEFGSLYATGRGVARDLELAHLLLDLACKHGDAAACRDLAELR